MARLDRIRRAMSGAVRGAKEGASEAELLATTEGAGVARVTGAAAEGSFASIHELLRKTAAGTPKEGEAALDSLFTKLKRAADRINKPGKTGRGLQGRVLNSRIKELATFLTGKPAADLNFGARLGTIRRQLVKASKLGATRAQIGMIAAGSLHEAGVATSETAKKTIAGMAERLGAGGAKAVQAIPGAEASRAKASGLRRTLSSKGLRGLAPFAGLMLLEQFIGARREGKQQKQQITDILERAAKSGPSAFGPLRTVEFIEAMGPEFLDRLVEDPALALAVHERLQSVAQQNLPRGVSVLRSQGAGNPEELLRQITGQ